MRPRAVPVPCVLIHAVAIIAAVVWFVSRHLALNTSLPPRAPEAEAAIEDRHRRLLLCEASHTAAAPATRAMNSRRLMDTPQGNREL